MLRGVGALEVLVQFAVTGSIGPLRCDAWLHEIVARLGPPQDLGPVSKRRRWPHRFGYGDVELCVCRCRRVESIDVQAWREEIELPRSQPDAAAIRCAGRLTHAQVLAGLRAVGCVVEPITPQPPGQVAVRAARSGVEFVFSMGSGSEPLLDSVGSWVAAHDCPPIRAGAPDDGLGPVAGH